LQIWYKALTTYFTSTTDYKAAREGTLKAASDLYGADSTEYKTVAAAWTAVNVG
ncbi:M4 family metallopeptidase, partial [Streptomyces sp. SID161]